MTNNHEHSVRVLRADFNNRLDKWMLGLSRPLRRALAKVRKPVRKNERDMLRALAELKQAES